MKLLFVGDVALGDHPKAVGFGFFSKYQKSIPVNISKNIFPSEIKADLIFGNLEFSLADDIIKGDKITDVYCKGLKEYAIFLKDAGFSIFNMANNHQYQHGTKRFNDTINNLKCKGLKVCGIPKDFNNGNIQVIDGISVVFLGWSNRPRQDFQEFPLYNELQSEKAYQI